MIFNKVQSYWNSVQYRHEILTQIPPGKSKKENEEERKMIRVKLMASVSPVALVWVVAGLGFRLRLNNIQILRHNSAFRLSTSYNMCCVGHSVYN